MNIEQILGKKSEKITLEALKEKASTYPRTHIDLGTGDGLYMWRLAKKQPETCAIGIDAAADSLREGSGRSIKKPAKGGAENAVFLCANVLETLKDDAWNAMADHVSVNFPWGSLLQAVAYPFPDFLPHIHKLLKEEGTFELHINMFVFDDEVQRKSLGLPMLDETYMEEKLIPAYKKDGFESEGYMFVAAGAKTEIQSTWGSKLTKRSGRPTLIMKFKKVS